MTEKRASIGKRMNDRAIFFSSPIVSMKLSFIADNLDADIRKVF